MRCALIWLVFLAGNDLALTFKEHPQDLKHLFSEDDLIVRNGRLDASIDRSSPVLRSSSKAPNRTRPEERVCMGTVHRP